MSEASVAARAAMKKKAARYITDPHEKVDASSWEPGEPMDADAKTGMRPISRRAYKRGGKVEGDEPKLRMDRKPRKSGGLAVDLMNRNQKDANEDRDGTKHVGGLKSGGRAGKMGGGGNFTDPRADATAALGPAADRAGVPTGRMNFMNANSGLSKELGIKTGGRVKRASGGQAARDFDDANDATDQMKDPGHRNGGRIKRASGGSISNAAATGMRPEGGRIARKDGGRAKGKTNINIIIAEKPSAPPMPPLGGPAGPPPGAGGPPPAMPMPPGGPAGAPPGAMPPQMMRKSGGRVANVHAGAGSGLGRLEKIDIQKRAGD